jgi:IclR family pca regulon transcriptional regulator
MTTRKTGHVSSNPAVPAQRAEPGAGDPNFMMSLARGLAILRACASHARESTIPQLSAETGIPRAAVRRVLYTLTQLGYARPQGRGYVLLPRVLGIASAYTSASSLVDQAQPLLDRLRDEISESCSLGVLDGDDLLYVARAETVRIMSIGLHKGSRLPAYCSSMGRILLADLPADTLAGYLQRTALRPRTEYTETDGERFRRLIEQVKTDGYALNNQDFEIGLRSIAVPVRDATGTVVAAMNVGSTTARISCDDLLVKILPRLRSAAAELERMLA